MSFDPFNPVALAQMSVGALKDAIVETPYGFIDDKRDWELTFRTALLLQAGLRALLPVEQRSTVPRAHRHHNDPKDVYDAQQNWRAVFDGGAVADERQKAAALKAIYFATRELVALGFHDCADACEDFSAGVARTMVRPPQMHRRLPKLTQ